MTLFSFSGDKAISSDARATITQNAGSDRNNSSIYLVSFLVVFGAGFAAFLASASLASFSLRFDKVLMVFLWFVCLIVLLVQHHDIDVLHVIQALKQSLSVVTLHI